MNVLGISCWYHDAAACLLSEDRIVAAAQEERFSREKHDASFPDQAIAYCLEEGGLSASELDYVAFYDKPFLKFERLLETYLRYAPRGLRSFLKAMPLWLKKKLWIPDRIATELGGDEFDGPMLFPEHHQSHAASAFFPSPFERAAILTTDGVGEWATTTWGVGNGSDLQLRAEIPFPHSLGLLYSAFTYYCGFRVNSGEYKLMGLAPYGEPRFADAIRAELIDVKDDGSFRLNMRYFTYPTGLRMTGRRFAKLFGAPRREPESKLTQRVMDLARSVQVVTEEVILKMARHVHRATGERNLCLAGGVALNCVANGRLAREGPFADVWIQPAAGDAGGALGAALLARHRHAGGERRPADGTDEMQGALLGPSFSDKHVERFLEREDVPHERADDPVRRAAQLLADGNVVGWFQGRMEWGPRALGNRSILADPRRRDMQRVVNRKIKFRESFRPFAPSVLAERASDYFDLDRPSPYMLLVTQVRGAEVEGEGLERLHRIDSPVPAVTHVDGSARIQTVHAETNPRYHDLLSAFEALTGCPVLINTSFNVRGEPIVCTPADAYRCFRRTHMDALAIGSFVVTKDMLEEGGETTWSEEQVAERYGLD
jgi:carbamoyltransferase